MNKTFRLTACVDVTEAGRIQMGFDVSTQDLDDMGGERELAIFLVCECLAKELPGKRPIFRTMEVYLRPMSDCGLS